MVTMYPTCIFVRYDSKYDKKLSTKWPNQGLLIDKTVDNGLSIFCQIRHPCPCSDCTRKQHLTTLTMFLTLHLLAQAAPSLPQHTTCQIHLCKPCRLAEQTPYKTLLPASNHSRHGRHHPFKCLRTTPPPPQERRSPTLPPLQENGCKTYKRLTLKCPNQQKVLDTMDFCQFTVVQIFLSIFVNVLSMFLSILSICQFVNLSIFGQFLSIFLKGQSLRIRQPLRFTFPSFTFNLFPSPEHVSHIY